MQEKIKKPSGSEFPSKELKKAVRSFLKCFNVRTHFVRKGWSSAIEDKLIEIDTRETNNLNELWSIVFHELSHVLCYRNGKYDKYHKEILPYNELAIYVRKYGLRAERYVDKVAKTLMNVYFPQYTFIEAYRTEEDIKWYYEWVNRTYPLDF